MRLHKGTHQSMCDECVYVFDCSQKSCTLCSTVYRRKYFFMYAYNDMVNLFVVMLNLLKIVFICSHKSVQAPHQCED